ncbi:MAG: hypothetical protein Q4F72_12775, partial [Desulfovibrionaceae bacterium]|nr:hypothetical protein [Desulfovibrionaceae bacterium]
DSARETLVLGLERQGAHGSWQALEAALDVMLTPAGMDLFSDHDDLEKKLLENMARTGCLPARVRLAEVLADAVGSFDRPPDRDRAEQLLEEAWEEGDADAGAMLALMQLEDLEEESRNGNGRDEEDEEGEKRERQRLRDLLGEAAMQGSGLACDALGEYGCLEARDREELEGALMWMDLAVVRGRCDRTLALAQAMAAQSFPRNIHARREDGLALLRLGANLGHAPFLAELAPWRLCGLDGEPADVPAGLAMLERALDAGSLTAAARLAEIRLLGLHGVAADPAAGIGLAARLADIVGIERGQALLDLAALGFFGEEAAALSPVSPQRVCRDLERAGPCSGQPEVLLRLHALLLPERTAELVQQARQADADDPDGPCDPDRPHERDEPDWPDAPDCEDGPRPGAEFRPRWPYPSDSGELAFALLDIFLAALYGADVAALRVFAACLERQPDTPALEELAGKFLKGLTAGGRGTCADLRRLAMRAVTDTARIAADPSDF